MTDHQSHRLRLAGLPYRFAYYLWANAPEPLVKLIRRSSRLEHIKNVCRDALAKGGNRDDIYSDTYYKRVDSLASRSAGAIGDMIVNEFCPRTAVDMGCGTGVLLLELRGRGVKVLGLELSRSAVEICRRRCLEVEEYDIEGATDLKGLGRFDVAICTEVAEHVGGQFADGLVDQLVALSDQIVFTAAVPGQGGGVDHVNEQPKSYWIGKFEGRGYEYLEGRTTVWRKRLLSANAVGFYANNLMLFRRKAGDQTRGGVVRIPRRCAT